MINTIRILLSLIVISVFLLSCSEKKEGYTVKRGRLVESVYSSVTIEPVDVHNVTSSVSGYIDRILVEKGDLVLAGDTLFVIRDVQSFNNAENAKLSLEIAKNSYSGSSSVLEEMKLELANLRLKMNNDSSTYKRNQELYKNGLITKVEFEASELAYRSSQNAVENADNKIRRMDKELRYSMEQARNNYSSSISRYSDAIIRSNMNGVVYDVAKENGEFISMQEPVAIVGAGNQFKIAMLIDEVDIIKVQNGQEVLVSLDAYPDKVFKAKVTRISPKMDARTQTFEVDGHFVERKDTMYMGLTGEANIIIRTREDVIVIPREYLIDGMEVETENGRVKVTTGAKSLSHVEIVSGLKEGDVIYKPK